MNKVPEVHEIWGKDLRKEVTNDFSKNVQNKNKQVNPENRTTKNSLDIQNKNTLYNVQYLGKKGVQQGGKIKNYKYKYKSKCVILPRYVFY